MSRRSLRPSQRGFLSLLKTICYCKIVIKAELQSMKCIICAFFTELFTIIKAILAPCYGLIFFKY